MKRLPFLALLALLSTGCTTVPFFHERPTVTALAKEYVTITGTLVAPPELRNGNIRLFIALQTEPEPAANNDVLAHDANGDSVVDTGGQVVAAPKPNTAVAKEVLLCVAENTDNKQVLINIAEYLKDPKAANKPVFLYGRRIDSAWKEFVTGINCYVNAVGVYVPSTGQYAVITTEYGDGMFDSVDWKSFLVTVGKTAIKFAK